jgi:hypothetical protein
MPERAARPRQFADALQERQLERELERAAGEDGPRERHDGWIEQRSEPQRENDEGDVKQRRRERRNPKLPVRVENAARKRSERDEQDVRERDPQQRDRDLEFFRMSRKTGRGSVDDERCGHDPDQRDDEQGSRQQRSDMVDQVARCLFARSCLVFGQNRHERLRKSPFGEHPAQQVRQAERDEKGVGVQPGAECLGDHGIAHKTEDARYQRHAADGDQGLEQIHCFSAQEADDCHLGRGDAGFYRKRAPKPGQRLAKGHLRQYP